MLERLSADILIRIKEIDWEFAVKRTGYFQSKVIVIKAEMKPLLITQKIALSYKTMLWVLDENIYDNDTTKSFANYFGPAFEEIKDWPIIIINKFHDFTKQKDSLLAKIRNVSGLDLTQKKSLFKEYYELLKQIQNYYVVARPLTNYCEAELGKIRPEYLKFAYPYEKLDVDHMNTSLRNLKKKDIEGILEEKDILDHINKFQWIKTAYNILEIYTEADVKNELQTVSPEMHNSGDIPNDYLLDGLRAGIYIRNRIKELSQQLWFGFEPLALLLAKDIEISRDNFFTLTYEEVIDILDGNMKFDENIINERKRGYVYGFIDNEELLITGEDYHVIEDAVIKKPEADVKEIKGQVACRGKLNGYVKVIRNQEDFKKLNDGDILVTTMTTPDYMIIIKKAAAIITDEGGLSCHAAIVSREFNIPCIMGTKVATKVLKDGDMVEVDAIKGIIKILNK